MKDITFQVLPHSCLLRQKMLFEHPSRYKKTAKHSLHYHLFSLRLIFFTRFASYLCPVQTAQFSCPSLVLFPPSSEEKQTLQVAQTQRDAWSCPTLNPGSKPQALSLVPDRRQQGVPRQALRIHAGPRRSRFQHLPKKRLSLAGIHRWKSSSAFTQGQRRGHSLSL